MILSWSTRGHCGGTAPSCGELFVGLAHALGDQLRGLSRRDAAAAAAQQRGRKCESCGHRTAFSQTLRPSDDSLPDGIDEIRAAKLTLRAETRDDHRRRPGQLPRIVGIGGDVQKWPDRSREPSHKGRVAAMRSSHR